MTHEINIDSREAFTAAEELEYNEYFDATEAPLDDFEELEDDAIFDPEGEWGDDEEAWEYEQDRMLEQQEREDFCECDESYGYYGGDEGW